MIELKPNDKVVHPMFGAGVVAAVAGSGPDAKITVDFAAAVGRKKLLAGVANLRPVAGASGDAEESAPAGWYEALDVEARPQKGRWVDRERLRDGVHIEVHLPRFWNEVREMLRARGVVPKVLDEINRRVSVTISGLLKLQIRVKHDAPNDARDSKCAAVMFEIIKRDFLRDFEAFRVQGSTGVDCKLIEKDIVEIEGNEEPLELPDREPKMRPKRVLPKGVIKALPKRRDDY